MRAYPLIGVVCCALAAAGFQSSTPQPPDLVSSEVALSDVHAWALAVQGALDALDGRYSFSNAPATMTAAFAAHGVGERYVGLYATTYGHWLSSDFQRIRPFLLYHLGALQSSEYALKQPGTSVSRADVKALAAGMERWSVLEGQVEKAMLDLLDIYASYAVAYESFDAAGRDKAAEERYKAEETRLDAMRDRIQSSLDTIGATRLFEALRTWTAGTPINGTSPSATTADAAPVVPVSAPSTVEKAPDTPSTVARSSSPSAPPSTRAEETSTNGRPPRTQSGDKPPASSGHDAEKPTPPPPGQHVAPAGLWPKNGP